MDTREIYLNPLVGIAHHGNEHVDKDDSRD